MTIGFATTFLTKEGAAFLLAADCRYSTAVAATDTGIKTYSLDRTTGAVVAGDALSVASAAELTRGFADDHNQLKPEAPINFYSTVRLFSFFLDQIEQKSPWSTGCEVVLTGFLSSGTPALAKVSTRPGQRTVVHIYAPKVTGALFLLVGKRDSKEQILSAVAQAMREAGEKWIERAVGTIAYLCGHQGEHTIGGAPAVAICRRGERMFWPVLVMGGRTYLRGFEMTATIPAHPPTPGDDHLHIERDEAWHAQVDQNRLDVPVKGDESFFSKSWYVDEWTPLSDAFNWKGEPDVLMRQPDLDSAPQYVALVRPDELSSTQSGKAGG